VGDIESEDSATKSISVGPHRNLGVGRAFPQCVSTSYTLIYPKHNLRHIVVNSLRTRAVRTAMQLIRAEDQTGTGVS
jgi:hypothetical protein